MILISKFIVIFATCNLCPKQKIKHRIFDLIKLTKARGDYHSLNKIYMFPKFIVSFSIEVNETLLASDNFSIIIAKLPIETEKSQNKK